MPLKTGKTLAASLEGIILEKFQVHRFAVDLTVKSISAAEPTGRVDFGGGEYAAAGRTPVEPVRERPDDSYKWWSLPRGCYFVEFNETLKLAEDEIAILEPSDRLMRAGGSHAPAFLRGTVAPIETLLLVDVPRIQIKQNARISHLRLLSIE